MLKKCTESSRILPKNPSIKAPHQKPKKSIPLKHRRINTFTTADILSPEALSPLDASLKQKFSTSIRYLKPIIHTKNSPKLLKNTEFSSILSQRIPNSKPKFQFSSKIKQIKALIYNYEGYVSFFSNMTRQISFFCMKPLNRLYLKRIQKVKTLQRFFKAWLMRRNMAARLIQRRYREFIEKVEILPTIQSAYKMSLKSEEKAPKLKLSGQTIKSILRTSKII